MYPLANTDMSPLTVRAHGLFLVFGIWLDMGLEILNLLGKSLYLLVLELLLVFGNGTLLLSLSWQS